MPPLSDVFLFFLLFFCIIFLCSPYLPLSAYHWLVKPYCESELQAGMGGYYVICVWVCGVSVCGGVCVGVCVCWLLRVFVCVCVGVCVCVCPMPPYRSVLLLRLK